MSQLVTHVAHPGCGHRIRDQALVPRADVRARPSNRRGADGGHDHLVRPRLGRGMGLDAQIAYPVQDRRDVVHHVMIRPFERESQVSVRIPVLFSGVTYATTGEMPGSSTSLPCPGRVTVT